MAFKRSGVRVPYPPLASDLETEKKRGKVICQEFAFPLSAFVSSLLLFPPLCPLCLCVS